jgi:hypothetical protein
MPASRPARRAIPGTAAVILTCAALAGCGAASGSPGNSTNTAAPTTSSPPTRSSSPASNGAASGGKLTGNFCTDFNNIGTNIQIPASAQGSLSALQRHAVPYLNRIASYFDGLAAEAPPQAGRELRILGSDYHAIAASISSGTSQSLSALEQQVLSLTTKGSASTALRQLITYVATKCA